MDALLYFKQKCLFLELTTLCYTCIIAASSTQLTLPVLNMIHSTHGIFPCAVSDVSHRCFLGCDPFLRKMERALCVWLEDEAQKELSVRWCYGEGRGHGVKQGGAEPTATF
jgi:hypothetical protein